jgi:hypothetical protein
MSETSARFDLPFVLPGQAQKELSHNEAITGIDIALHPAVEGAPIGVPPAVPLLGQCWLVAAGSQSGAWAGQGDRIACWTSGGWRFVRPQPGMRVWDKLNGWERRWTGNSWSAGELSGSAVLVSGLQVLGPRQPAVPSPSGGTTIDVEARNALAALTVALKTHGLID